MGTLIKSIISVYELLELLLRRTGTVLLPDRTNRTTIVLLVGLLVPAVTGSIPNSGNSEFLIR